MPFLRKAKLGKWSFGTKLGHHKKIQDLDISTARYKTIKETKSATMNIFQKNYFLFKSFVKAELS